MLHQNPSSEICPLVAIFMYLKFRCRFWAPSLPSYFRENKDFQNRTHYRDKICVVMFLKHINTVQFIIDVRESPLNII